MLASTKKSNVRSTVSSSMRGSVAKKNESFFAYIFRKFKELFSGLWMYSRKFLWVSTTALIVIILPFAFAYFLEMQKQMMKMQGMDGRANLM